jgi:hypothetical protein
MATKKTIIAAGLKARKRKRGFRFFLLSLFAIAGIASLALLFFTLSDFIGSPDSSKSVGEKKKVRHTVELYFSDSNERFLVPEKRNIPKPAKTESQAEEIIRALIDGPKTDLTRTFPEETKLLAVKINQGIASVDFDSSLISLHPGGSASEIATIYSLTNSLTANIPEIKRVKILIQGKSQETLKGHMDTSRAFTFNKEIIQARSGE